MLKKIQKLILALLVLANLATPALGLPANSKTNHALLHLALLVGNIVIPIIPNAIEGKRERKEDPSKAINAPASWRISYKHLIDLYNLFKKEEVKESETPKTFKQKWTEFTQTHKTSAWLIYEQLAALAISGVYGAWAKRYLAIIAKCYVNGDVFNRLTHISHLPEKCRDGRAIWFPYGFTQRKPNEVIVDPYLIFYSLRDSRWHIHPESPTKEKK